MLNQILNFNVLSGTMGTNLVIEYTMVIIFSRIKTMAPIYLIPLLISLIAGWISLCNPQWRLDDLPKLLAVIIGITCLIWFFIAAPWLIKLTITIILLIFGNLLIADTSNLRE